MKKYLIEQIKEMLYNADENLLDIIYKLLCKRLK